VRERLALARRLVVRHLSAVSQTFFVYNPWVGLVGVAVLAIAAPHLAVSAIVASVIARWVAGRAGAARTLLDSGLVELNGWFLGLACGTFYKVGPGLLVALLVGGALAATLSIVLHRVLATWDVPLLVGPYVPAFWLLWCAFPAFPWMVTAELPGVPPTPASPLLLVVLGGLRGVGEIFFLPNAAVGAGLAVAASIVDRRVGPAMVAASIASVGVGYLAGSPTWQVEQGLAGFTAAMVAAAALRGFSGLGWVAVVIGVLASPFLESAALRLAGAVGLHALSVPYLGFFWTFALLRPVREAATARGGWSMGTRPRMFENG